MDYFFGGEAGQRLCWPPPKLLGAPAPISVHILNWYFCDLVLLFHMDTEGKCGWIIGGPKAMMPPPKLLGAWPPVHPPPS